MDQFAFSSTALRRQTLDAAVALAVSRDWILEFSSGVPYSPNLSQDYLAASCRKLVHNYFPAPESPFVLNLASLNPEIHARSVAHAISNLELTSLSQSAFYSIHAGFCLDPKPSELGSTLSSAGAGSRSEHWRQFVATVRSLALEAEKRNVGILIENNVVTAFNVQKHGHNPLLCVDAEELQRLVKEVDHPSLGVLIDTGHWKVSAQTMGFNYDSVLRLVEDVVAFHHSDNDGKTDSNHAIDENYWLLPMLGAFLRDLTHVLEVHDQTEAQIAQQRDLIFRSRKKL